MQALPALEQISIEKATSLNSLQTNFLASAFWADFKSKHGWRALFFKTPSAESFFSVLVRNVRGFSIAYIPMQYFRITPQTQDGQHSVPVTRGRIAPDAREATDFFILLSQALKPFLPKRTLLVRFDPPFDFFSREECAAWKSAFNGAARDAFKDHGRHALFSISDVQPPNTVVLDLSLSEDELLSRMKSKWRYNIGLAQKKGVTSRVIESQNAAAQTLSDGIDVFYALYLETAKRDKIAIHSRAYYETLFHAAASVRLYIAEHEGEPIACIITLFFNAQAVYLYGASTNVKRNLMAPYLLQWRAITDAKKAGCKEYDFYGIPPNGDEHHPMHGLYRFKTGFGGTIIHRPGSIDAPLSPLYGAFRAAENARSFYYKRLKKGIVLG